MSAASRLWRRAPLWRMSVVVCLACASLTAMFPAPMLDRALLRRGPPPPPAQLLNFPPMDAAFHDRVAFAGRTLALPPGEWHEVVVGRVEREAEIDLIGLARFEAGAVTGLIAAQGSVTPPASPMATVGIRDCRTPDDYAAASTAQPDDPLHSCWLVRRTDLDPAALDPGDGRPRSAIAAAAFERLRRLDIAPPVFHLLSAWSHTDGGQFVEVNLFEPGSPGDEKDALKAATRRIRSTWAPALERGYGSRLAPPGPSAAPSAPASTAPARPAPRRHL